MLLLLYIGTHPRSGAIGARRQRLKSRHASESHVNLVDRTATGAAGAGGGDAVSCSTFGHKLPARKT